MTKEVTIEGERFFCYRDTLDDAGRLLPGFYVRDVELGRLLALTDPVWPERVRQRLPFGKAVRNLIAVSEPDGETKVLGSTTVDLAIAGPDWSVDVVLAPSGTRHHPVRMTLPFGRKSPAELCAASEEA